MDVKDLLYVSVVRCDLEDSAGLVLRAGDVDGHNVVRHPRPADLTVLFLHLEYLSPQPGG